MASTAPLRVEHSLWYTPCTGSPTLPFGEVTLDFNLVPGVSATGPTTVLCGACNAEASLASHYGGRLTAAIRIVMMNPETGAVSTATVRDHEGMPLLLGATPPSASPARTAGGPTAFTGSYFNVDLGAHLFLPPKSAPYHVLLWLDGLVSPLKSVVVSADPSRAPRAPSREQLRSVAPLDLAQRPPPAALTLAWAGSGAAARVEIALPQRLLDSGPPAPRLGLFAQTARSRALRFLVEDPLPKLRSGASSVVRIDPVILNLQRAPGEELHLVAIVGPERSNVVTVPFGDPP